MKRLLLLFFGLAVLVAIPFLIWGAQFEARFSSEAMQSLLAGLGSWGWIAALGLLASDLFLPVPGTAVMSGLGLVYGPLLGGLVGALGSILGGLLGYGLCRRAGRSLAVRLVGEKSLSDGEVFFTKHGGWAVALSRWLPIFPEVLACLAGATRMPFPRFLTSLMAGSLPMALLYAWIGHTGKAHPGPVLLASALVPALLWAVISLFLIKGKQR